jgi:hypothetical protein
MSSPRVGFSEILPEDWTSPVYHYNSASSFDLCLPQLIVLTANHFVLILSTQATAALRARPKDGGNVVVAAALKCFVFYGGASPSKPLGPPPPGTLSTPPGCLFCAAARRCRRRCCSSTSGAARRAVRRAEEPGPGSPSPTSCSAMSQVSMLACRRLPPATAPA